MDCVQLLPLLGQYLHCMNNNDLILLRFCTSYNPRNTHVKYTFSMHAYWWLFGEEINQFYINYMITTVILSAKFSHHIIIRYHIISGWESCLHTKRRNVSHDLQRMCNMRSFYQLWICSLNFIIILWGGRKWMELLYFSLPHLIFEVRHWR